MPSIAVIIPCWNAEKWVGRAITSVLDQNYLNREIIVIDDGSTDGSLDIIRSFEDRIHWKTGPNRGASAARNLGVELATAEYILFLDADDYLHGNYLEALAEGGKAAADVVIGGYVREGPGGRTSHIVTYRDLSNYIDLIAAYLTCFLQTSGFLWRKSFFKNGGGWNTELLMYQDVDLALRLFLTGPTFQIASLAGSCAVYNSHDGSNRISNCLSPRKLASAVRTLDGFGKPIAALKSSAATRALSEQYYVLAMVAYSNGLIEWGRKLELGAREHGLRGHVGNTRHRIACFIFGLERKIVLAKMIRTSIQSLKTEEISGAP